MENLQTTPRNELFGRFADILKQGKNAANQYAMKDWVPLIGGTGLGDMFMGKAPELVDDISYDGLQAAIRGGNAATGGIGTYGARPAVADAALLGMDAAGLAKGLGALAKGGGRAITNRLTEGATDTSRREFMKKAGALAGSTVAAGSGVGLLRKFGDNAVADVLPKIADNVAVQATKKYKFNSLQEYIDHVKYRADDELGISAREIGGFSDREYENFIEDNLESEVRSMLKQDASSYATHKANAKLYGNPDRQLNPLQTKVKTQADTYLDKNSFSPEAKQQMNDLKDNVSKLHSQYGISAEDDWARWIANSDDINQTNQILKDMQLNINPME